jgi:hypothetical protein
MQLYRASGAARPIGVDHSAAAGVSSGPREPGARSSGALKGQRPLRIFSARHISILWQNPHDREMNHNLPSLTLAVLISSGVTAGLLHQPGAQAWEPGATAAESPGDQLVAAAARRVQGEAALSADLRYRIDAFGHELVGLGSYRQLGSGPEKLLRMELKIQVADQAVTRQEICGPQFYWIRRQSPLAAASLGRVNLRQVRLAAERTADPGIGIPGSAAAAANPADVWILLGGLPKLLESLHQNFNFTAPREDELQFTSADGEGVERLPVLVVRGTWKPEPLAQLLHDGKVPGSPNKPLPEQLPDAVELVLGRADQVLPHFPYRVTYLKRGQPAGQGREGELKPLLSIDLFNVYRKGDIDPRDFEYNPGGQEVADLTQTYLERLGLATKTR